MAETRRDFIYIRSLHTESIPDADFRFQPMPTHRGRHAMEMIIEIRDLVKQYPTVRAVDGVSFSVSEGVCFGLLGPARRTKSN